MSAREKLEAVRAKRKREQALRQKEWEVRYEAEHGLGVKAESKDLESVNDSTIKAAEKHSALASELGLDMTMTASGSEIISSSEHEDYDTVKKRYELEKKQRVNEGARSKGASEVSEEAVCRTENRLSNNAAVIATGVSTLKKPTKTEFDHQNRSEAHEKSVMKQNDRQEYSGIDETVAHQEVPQHQNPEGAVARRPAQELPVDRLQKLEAAAEGRWRKQAEETAKERDRVSF